MNSSEPVLGRVYRPSSCVFLTFRSIWRSTSFAMPSFSGHVLGERGSLHVPASTRIEKEMEETSKTLSSKLPQKDRRSVDDLQPIHTSETFGWANQQISRRIPRRSAGSVIGMGN